MGKWATYQRRGGGAQNAIALPIPILGSDLSGNIMWSVVLVVPDTAQVEQSADGSTGWSIEASPAWSDLNYAVLQPGTFYRVIGLDSGNNPVTQYSNIVQAF